jgi:hypothetical protein
VYISKDDDVLARVEALAFINNHKKKGDTYDCNEF